MSPYTWHRQEGKLRSSSGERASVVHLTRRFPGPPDVVNVAIMPVQVPAPLLSKPHGITGASITPQQMQRHGIHVPSTGVTLASTTSGGLCSAVIARDAGARHAQACDANTSAHSNWLAAEAGAPPSQGTASKLRAACKLAMDAPQREDSTSNVAAAASDAVAAHMTYSHAPVTVSVMHAALGARCAHAAANASASTALAARDATKVHCTGPTGTTAADSGAAAKRHDMQWPPAERLLRVSVPAAWGRVLLPELAQAGAVAVGEAEWRAIRAMHGVPTFPFDHIACPTYWCAAADTGLCFSPEQSCDCVLPQRNLSCVVILA